MALYRYQAFSRGGKKTSGTIDAGSIKQVREQLARDGLYPISIEPATEASKQPFSFSSLFERSVTIKDKIFFTKQLGVLLRAGVPLVDSLNLLVDQTEGKMKAIVMQLRDGLREGKSLADGLSLYPKVFEPIYIQLVRAGEASGRLEVIFERLTAYLERQEEVRRQVRSAMMMPMIQLGMIVVVVFIFLLTVVPNITKIFVEQDMALPLPTQILYVTSGFLKSYYLLITVLIILAYLVYRSWRATAAGRRAIDSLKLKIPIVNYFARMGAVVSFSRTLGMLLEGGVNLPESLDIVTNIVDNRILVDTLKQAREQIVKQGRIAEYLKKTGLFPSMAIYLINTGEQSGKLDEMLTAVAQQYEMELAEYSQSLVTKLNPIMLILVAGVVGFIILAIMLPMLNLGSALQKLG